MIPDHERDGNVGALGLKELAELLDNRTLDPRMVQHDYLTQPISMNMHVLSHPSNLYHSMVQVSQRVLPSVAPTNSTFPLAYGQHRKPLLEQDAEVYERFEDLGNERPQCSYIDMIKRALKTSSTGQMKLKEIYEWIMTNYPYFRSCRLQWKV
jgi:hypothetical protein